MGDGEGGGIEMKHVKRQGVSYSQKFRGKHGIPNLYHPNS